MSSISVQRDDEQKAALLPQIVVAWPKLDQPRKANPNRLAMGITPEETLLPSR